MAATADSDRAPERAPAHPKVDQTPDPDEIDRTPAIERGSKMPSMPGTALDPKKMIGLAAAAGAVMFTVLALGHRADRQFGPAARQTQTGARTCAI